MTNSALEGVQERAGATPEAIKAAAAAADKAGYEAIYRKINGLRPSAVPVNNRPGPLLLNGPEGGAAAGPIPTAPKDVAAQTIGAGALGPQVASVAQKFPSLYAAASGASVPPAAASAFQGLTPNLAAAGVKPGPLVDMLASGIESGQASLIHLAKVDEDLRNAALTEQGAHPQTLRQHSADIYTAAQRPGETLVAHTMQVQDEKNAVLARAQATQDVWDEAHRVLKEHEATQRHDSPTEKPIWERFPQMEGENYEQYNRRLENKLLNQGPSLEEAKASHPIPGRAEALAHAEEAGVPIEQAAEAHRAEALKSQEDGTLDPGIAQEYVDQGDDSFDPAALEAEQFHFPDTATPPHEMTPAELAKSFGLDPEMAAEVHRSITEDRHVEAEKAQEAERKETLETNDIKAQPMHDLLRKLPIGEKWIKKLGLAGEFKNFKGVTVKGGTDENKVDQAVEKAVQSGLLPEGSSVNDLLDLLDHESRKGTKAQAEASLVRDEAEKPDLSQFQAAIKDPASGNVYTGPNHASIADQIMKTDADVAFKRLALKAAADNTDDAGFVDAGGKFITRTQAQEKYGFRTSQELHARQDAKGGDMVRDHGFSDDAQGFLFDDQGRTNPDAIEQNHEPRPAPKAAAEQEGLPLSKEPAAERKPLIENPSANPDAKETGDITDVGQELWYNRRNLIGKGLKWDDIRGMNATLKVLEVQKTKVWPRPDYEAMVEGGMHPITAHLVKQVFDSIAIKPEVSGVPKDDDMETYIAEVQRVKDETFKWAKIVEKMKNEKPYTTGTIPGAADESKLWPFVNFHERGGITLYGMDNVDERAVRLIDRLYPTKGASSMRFRDNEDYLRKVRLLGGNRFIRALQFDRGSQLDAQKAVKAGWPEPQEAWIKRFRIEKYPKGTEIHTSGIGYGKLEKDQFFVQNRGGGFWKKGSIVSKGFDTQAEAEVAAKDMAKKTAKRQESAEKNLTEAQRNGPVYRPAGLDVTPKSLQEKFGFRGVNFGNYTDQAERQAFTNRSYDALNDLAEVVGIPPQAISLNGTLGLAYGAQGRGGKNAAAAHFVPGVNEINLTKDNGGGTLAHEWAHALDHYFAVQAGDVLAKSPEPFITHHIDTYNADGKLSALRPEIVQAFKDISHAINKTMETPEKVQARMEATKNQAVARLESWANFFGSQIESASSIEDKPAVMREFDALVDRLRAGDLGEGFEQIGRTQGPQNQIHSTTGEIRRFLADKMGRAPDPSNIKALDFAAHLLKRTGEAEWADKNAQSYEQQSTYMTEARKLEGGKGGKKNYWTKETEMFARAFQSYILDKLADAERRSDYLTYPQGPAELYQKIEGGDRYPRGVEREKINASFDTLVNALKTRETEAGMMIYDAAYHGSPSRFDEFSTEHIGSGEGAQAFGWGLYFAGKEEVAKFYRDKLTGRDAEPVVKLNGKELSTDEMLAAYFEPGNIVHSYSGFDRVIKFRPSGPQHPWSVEVIHVIPKGDGWVDAPNERPRVHGTFPESNNIKSMFLEEGHHLAGYSVEKPGALYKVELAPKQDEYLDWNKPLSEQSDKVKAALESIGITIGDIKYPTLKQAIRLFEGGPAQAAARQDIGTREVMAKGYKLAQSGDEEGFKKWFADHGKTLSLGRHKDRLGEDAYHELVQSFARHSSDPGAPKVRDDKAASMALAAAGIPGIRYKADLIAKNGYAPSSNYVLFDDKHVQITQISDEQAKAYGPGVDMDKMTKQIMLDLDFGGKTGIPAKLAADGKIDYRGIEINDIQDIAEVIASRRHPKLEHNNFVLMKEGKVVSHMVFTSGRPNAVIIEQADFDELTAQMEKTGADALYTGHNHPSGNPTPSIDDKAVNAKLRLMFAQKYKGMVTTDGNDFFHTTPEGRANNMAFRTPQEQYPAPKGSAFTDSTSSEEVVAYASKQAMLGKKHTLLLQNARAIVIAIEHFDMDANIPAAIKDAIVRHSASRAILVAPKMPSSRLTNLPFEVKDVISIDKDGKASGYQAYQSGESAYGPIQSIRVAEGEQPEPLPRYMGENGMDASDFEKALAESKIVQGSTVTTRARIEGVKKGSTGIVVGIDKAGVRLMVKFGDTFRVTRPENLVETNRKPAARAAVESAMRAEAKSGTPSMSVKKIVKEGQAGLAAGTPVQMSELEALSEKFKNMNKGVRLGAREATKAMRAKMDARIDEFNQKVSGLKDSLKFSKAEAQANANWLKAEQDAIRGEIVDYINGALPVEARGKFLTTVKNADTVSKMLFARQAIDDAVADLHKKGLLADVRKLVPRILDSPGVDVKAKQAIREYLADVELKGRSAATYARLRKTLDFMVGQEASGVEVGLPKAVVEELDILGRRPLKDMSEAEIEGIYTRLKMLEEIGRTTVKVRESLYLLERERISNEILADLKPLEARQMTAQSGYKPLGRIAELQNRLKAGLNWMYDKNLALTPPDVVWDMLSKTPQYNGMMVKYFSHRIGASYARALDGYDAPIQKGRDIIDKFKMDEETINRVTAHAYYHQPGGAEYLENRLGLSAAEVKEAATLPESVGKDGARVVSPGALELYNHWREALDAVYPQLADSVRFNDNQEVGRRVNYFPVRFEQESALDVGEKLADKIVGLHKGFQKNVQMGNLKSRAGSNRGVSLDGRATFEAYMRLAWYKIAMSRDVRMLGEVASSPEFAAGAGEFGTRFAKQFVTLLARRGAPRVGDIIPRLDNARRAGSVFAIVGRLPTAAVHMTLLSNAASISGPGPIFGAFKDVMAQSRDQDPALETWWRTNDPGYRQAHGDDPVFQDATDVAHWNSSEWWKALTTPSSLRYIVRKATLATLEGNYRQALKKRGLERDLSAPVNQDALNEAKLLTRRAIPSTDLPHMFLAYNSGDVLTGNLSMNRVATQFKNFTIDRWSAYAHDLPAMVKGKRYADAANFVFWQTASDFVETGIRHGYKWALTAALGTAAAEMDDDHRKFATELLMKILEKPPFVPDVLNALMYGRVPTATASLAYDGLIAKPHDMMRAHELGQTRKFYQSMTEGLVDMAAMAGVPIPFGGSIEQVMRMVLADGGVRYPYADERTRLNNIHQDGNLLPEELQRRALLNHNAARFEKLNHNYKQAMKDGRTQDAAEILDGMRNLAHGAKP
jgi:phosphoglycolate phosphatase-like HAD superfamily hydrolase